MQRARIFHTASTRLGARVRRLLRDVMADRESERQFHAILEQLKTLNERVADVSRREAQIRAILRREIELESDGAALEDVLGRADTCAHVARAVGRAKLRLDPFPYAVVDGILPGELYQSLLKGLPPVELFSDRPVNKQQLTVPFALAPSYSRRVWRFMASVAVPDYIVPAVVERFRLPLDEWIAQNWPDVPPGEVRFNSSDGRILLRRRGYQIPPHRDPKWGFLTCIVYLARRSDSERWGTQLYTVKADEEAAGPSPHWVDRDRCEQVTEVEFRPNRMLVLLNSVGAHGACIPDDAEPANLERYIYQFRIAPTVDSMAMLKAALPEERRPLWAGKAGDY